MKKILVCEDGVQDFWRRYSFLLEENQIDLYLQLKYDGFELFKLRLKEWEDWRREKGVKPHSPYPNLNAHKGLPTKEDLEKLDFDFYFTDGLEGKCFEVLRGLEKNRDKAYICSGDPAIIKEAERKGYNIIFEDQIKILFK